MTIPDRNVVWELMNNGASRSCLDTAPTAEPLFVGRISMKCAIELVPQANEVMVCGEKLSQNSTKIWNF